jgi:hypothetical protein
VINGRDIPALHWDEAEGQVYAVGETRDEQLTGLRTVVAET